MANKLATSLETDSIFTIEDCLVAQGDIKMIEKVVNTLIIEFDQAAYEESLSSGSRSPSPSRTLRRIKLRVSA